MLKALDALDTAMRDVQKELIKALLTATGGNRTVAAQCIGINRTTLIEMMRRIGLGQWMPEVRFPIQNTMPAASLKIDGFDYSAKPESDPVKCQHKPTKATLIKIKMVMHALENNNNNRSRAASELGLDPRTVMRLVKTARSLGFISKK